MRVTWGREVVRPSPWGCVQPGLNGRLAGAASQRPCGVMMGRRIEGCGGEEGGERELWWPLHHVHCEEDKNGTVFVCVCVCVCVCVWKGERPLADIGEGTQTALYQSEISCPQQSNQPHQHLWSTVDNTLTMGTTTSQLLENICTKKHSSTTMQSERLMFCILVISLSVSDL